MKRTASEEENRAIEWFHKKLSATEKERDMVLDDYAKLCIEYEALQERLEVQSKKRKMNHYGQHEWQSYKTNRQGNEIFICYNCEETHYGRPCSRKEGCIGEGIIEGLKARSCKVCLGKK